MGIETSLPADAVKVLPGEYFATSRGGAIVTVLGSCVAACVRDRVAGIGGMNHFMLPRGRDDSSPASSSARYGVHAMELLINHLVRLGARRCNLEAKVFGGGNVLEGFTALNVGRDNAEFVTEFLRTESIPVVASDLQGNRSRKVCYFPASGRALVRALGGADRASLAQREARYVRRVAEMPGAGDVEFFR
jgi:chemotaxis protein CheD